MRVEKPDDSQRSDDEPEAEDDGSEDEDEDEEDEEEGFRQWRRSRKKKKSKLQHKMPPSRALTSRDPHFPHSMQSHNNTHSEMIAIQNHCD